MNSIAVVADVHINCRKYKEFESSRFLQLIEHLTKQEIQTVIFAGDLFDHARPSLEEIQLAQKGFKMLHKANLDVLVLAGNHENISKTESTFDFLDLGIKYIEDTIIGTNSISIRLLSWHKLKDHNTSVKSRAEILITHVRANFGVVQEEYPVKDLSNEYELVLLGDIHARYSPYKNVHYTSSPYSTKFVQSTKGYGYIILDLDTKDFKYIDLDLPCKVKAQCNYKDVKSTIKAHSKHLLKLEVQGTLEELSSLKEQDGVIFIKYAQESTVQLQAQHNQSIDTLNLLEPLVLSSELVQRYPDKHKDISKKINELKGQL